MTGEARGSDTNAVMTQLLAVDEGWRALVAKTFLGQTMSKIGLDYHWSSYDERCHLFGCERSESSNAREQIQFAIEVRGRTWNPAWATTLDAALRADLDRGHGLKYVWLVCMLAIMDAEHQYAGGEPADPMQAMDLVKVM